MFLATYLTNHDDHILHPFYLGNDILHLAQLNAQSAQLNLVVLTSQDEHIAVGSPLGVVARLIDARAVIVDEALSGHVVQVVIAPAYTSSADIELAHHAYGQLVAVAVNDKLLNVELRPAYGDALGMGQFLDVRRYGSLCRSIGVQYARRCELLHLVEQALGQLFAAEADDGYGADGLDKFVAIDPCLPL